ncbi:MAG: phosphopantetheine-binding [Myxococcaceae bacterium]|nr:phosphopantetheine-binding [Myxococcaceae bacterium]
MSKEAVASATRADVYSVILGVLPSLTAGQIDERLHLKDLGADSVDRVEIIMELRQRLGLDEPMGSFSELPSIQALIDLLDQLRARLS